ncbi:TetR/AcrR family transcriptional regulator [Bacteriovoracaceae bacterium]|nr:TetR/AcrR family transcriptional regulator [Bacteriovoracaceae bacterium]
MDNKRDTKEIILECANKLFAQKGFDGTSIRDICNEADVNVSSINYHFKNKESLYQALFEKNRSWFESQIKNIGEDKSLTTVQFVKKLYDFFLDNGSALMNCFKIMLTDSVSPPEAPAPGKEDPEFGPPGGRYLLEVISRDVGEDIPYEARFWAMRMIFSNIFHHGIIISTSYVCSMKAKAPNFTRENQERDFEYMVTALLTYLKENPQKWS